MIIIDIIAPFFIKQENIFPQSTYFMNLSEQKIINELELKEEILEVESNVSYCFSKYLEELVKKDIINNKRID